MATSADRILARGLERHGVGDDLAVALGSAVDAEVRLRFAAASLTRRAHVSPWSTWYAKLTSPALDASTVLDQCFRWSVVTEAPRSSEVVRSVSVHLVGGLGSVEAVCRALDDQHLSALQRRWCALGSRLYAPHEVMPFLRPYLVPAFSSIPERIGQLTRWVHSAVTWTSDMGKWHMPDYWQAPAVTLAHGTGDCEDQALVLWSAAPLVGLPKGLLVIGELHGRGHAWIEFPELPIPLLADATSGTVFVRDLAPQFVPRLRVGAPAWAGGPIRV